MPDLADMHRLLCNNLQGVGNWRPDWRLGCVCAFRSSLKSSIATIGYPLWRGLYEKNFATRIIGSSFDNAKVNFLEKAQAFFRDSDRAEHLQWVFEERIPQGFAGWNENQLVMVRDDPFALPTISIKGLNADQEGAHVNVVIFDDPEGAEAERSMAVQTDARRAVAGAAPLLIDPDTGQILCVLTPHGPDPLAFRLRHENLDPHEIPQGDVELDNAKRHWQLFWVPIVDSEGNPAWPERFGKEQIAQLKKMTDPETFQKQYLLQRTATTGEWFDEETIRENFAHWKNPGRVIGYTAMKYNKKLWYKKGEVELSFEEREVNVADLRVFLHYDPLHKEDAKSREGTSKRAAKAAVVATGVAPDGHVFVLAYWTDAKSVEEQLRQLYLMHAKFGAYKATLDPIGAQAWVFDILRMLERKNEAFQNIKGSVVWSDGKRLPRLSAIMVEDSRPRTKSKDAVIYDRLEGWISLRQLHFFADQDELLTQLLGFPDQADYVDLIDALAQGPPVWEPGIAKDRYNEARRDAQKLKAIAQKHTGYISPFVKLAKKDAPVHPDLAELHRKRVV